MRTSILALAATTILISACATKPPRVAQPKVVKVAGVSYEFGGVFDVENNSLVITVNGERLMSGSFYTYNPSLQLKAPYKDKKLSASCYFGSILGSKGGVFGIVAGAVQAGNNKSGDICDISIDDKPVEKLYF